LIRFGGLKKLKLGKGLERGKLKKETIIQPIFFTKANQRRRKKAIFCLVDGEKILTENKDLIDHVV
jgi:hypothetical protein